MTRTVLNWSELLVQYHKKDIGVQKRLKKWSKIGEPEITKEVPKLQNDHNYENSTYQKIVDLDKQPNQIYEFDNIDDPIEFETPEDAEGENINKPVKKCPPRATLLELFYDCMMQDTDTIPAMLAKSVNGNDRPEIEEDSLLLELLEVNFEKRESN